MAATRSVLYLVSTLFTIVGVVRILFPSYVALPVDKDIVRPFVDLTDMNGMTCIALAMLYCTTARTATVGAIHSVSISHLLAFFVTLYLWEPLLNAGFTRAYLQGSCVFNVLVGLVLMGEAAAEGKKSSSGKSNTYVFTMFLSLAHFAAFAAMFFAPSEYAKYVLDYVGTSATLLTHIQIESVLPFTASALLCVNARACTRQFALGMSSAGALIAVWALVSSGWSPLATGPCCCKKAGLGAFMAFVALYYALNAPARAPTSKPATKTD